MNNIRKSFGTPSIGGGPAPASPEYKQVRLGWGTLIATLGAGQPWERNYYGLKATSGVLLSIPSLVPTTSTTPPDGLAIGIDQNGGLLWIGGKFQYKVGTDTITSPSSFHIPQGSLFLVLNYYNIQVSGEPDGVTGKVYIPAVLGA